jgi:hypothetical protein
MLKAKNIFKIEITDYSTITNISRDSSLGRKISLPFEDELPKIKQLLENIDTLKKYSPDTPLPKEYFDKLIYASWYLFVGLRMHIHSKDKTDKDQADYENTFLEKEYFPLFDTIIETSLQELYKYFLYGGKSKQQCSAIKEYLLMLREFDQKTLHENNFIKRQELATKFAKIAPDYGNGLDVYMHIEINDMLDYSQHEKVYNNNMAYFQAFGISEYMFKNYVYADILGIIKNNYFIFNTKPNFTGKVAFLHESTEYYHHIISLLKLLQCISKKYRTLNQNRAYIFLLRRAFIKLKKDIDSGDALSNDLINYIKNEMRDKIINGQVEDTKNILEAIQLAGIEFDSGSQGAAILKLPHSNEFEQELLNTSSIDLINQYSVTQLYEHYFSWLNLDSDLNTEQFQFLRYTTKIFTTLNLPIFLEVLAILAVRGNKTIAKHALDVLDKMLNKLQGNCNMAFIYTLLYSLSHDLVSTTILNKIYGKISVLESEESSAVIAIMNEKGDETFIIKNNYMAGKTYWHQIDVSHYGILSIDLLSRKNDKFYDRFFLHEADTQLEKSNISIDYSDYAIQRLFSAVFVNLYKNNYDLYAKDKLIEIITLFGHAKISKKFAEYLYDNDQSKSN